MNLKLMIIGDDQKDIIWDIPSIALLIVLIIQVNWILETAKIKEELFNEKANIILARTTDALLSNKETCKNLQTCVGQSVPIK